MKFIQKYENFTTDDNRADNQSFPKYNQADRLKAKQYVDQIFSGGSGPEVVEMCKEIGCDRPTNDEELESVKEKALEYFIDNPERIKEVGMTFKSYPYSGGGNDGIVRTNNVGGVVRESKGEKDVKVVLNDDEMKLFSSETLLLGLIRKNKISLHDKEVWYAKDDKETKKILDLFFEIDDDKINEGIGTVLLTIFLAHKLLKWILGIFIKRERGKFMNGLKSTLRLLSVSMIGTKDGMQNALSVAEFGDRYYVRGVNTLLGRIPDIRIFKNEKAMIFDETRVELTDKEYQEFLEIITKRV